MRDTSARLLRLLALLQSHRDWTSADLAERLGVATRTVRKDVERLRSLGYPVDARPGVAGGYRLGHGGSLPPLLLDDDEAVALAVGLRTAPDVDDVAIRALVKLQHVLPARLHRRVDALARYAVPTAGPRTDPGLLATLAAACRSSERLRFDYRSHDGTETRRDVEPYRLVHERRRWYLFAWDPHRNDWRTFRADRIAPKVPGGPRFTPRQLPSDDEIAARVARGVATAPWRYRARVIVDAPAEHVRARVPADVREVGDRCEFTPGSDNPLALAAYLGMLDADFTVVDAPELAAALEKLADRYRRATYQGTGPASSK